LPSQLRIPRGVLVPLVVLVSLSSFFSLGYFGLEAYIKSRRIPLSQIRGLVTSLINKELGKAVDLGVVDFSLREGIILEDLVISQEEDFAFNQNLLKVKKVTFRFNQYLKNLGHIDRVDLYSPTLTLDTGSAFTENLVKYYQETKLAKLVIHDAKLILKKDEFGVMEWKKGWDIYCERKNGKILIQYQNGNYWIPGASRILGEAELPDLGLDRFRFRFQWKNVSTDETRYVTQYIFGGKLQLAETTGEAVWEKTKEGVWSASGNVDFQGANILISGQYGIFGLTFRERFFIQPEKEEREYFANGANLLWVEERVFTPKEVLEKRKISFQSEDLSFFAKHIQEVATGEYLPFGGRVRGELKMEETGEKNKWFRLQGDIHLSESYWQSPLITWSDGNLDLQIIEPNSINLSSTGFLFGKSYQMKTSANFDAARLQKKDGFYYPINSKIRGNMEVDKVIFSEWFPLYENWKKSVLEDIRERQEKIIPEEFFYQSKIFKYVLEYMYLDFQLTSKETKGFPELGDLGIGKINMQIQNGRVTLQSGAGNQKMNLNSTFSTKQPSLVFNLQLVNFPWQRDWMTVCGVGIIPTNLTLDYMFSSSGSDYYTLSKDSRSTSYVSLNQARLETPDFLTKNGLENSKEPIQMEFQIDRYFETEYIRNVSVQGPGIDWKGFGQRKLGNLSFNLYGSLGSNRSSWTIVEEEGRCSAKY